MLKSSLCRIFVKNNKYALIHDKKFRYLPQFKAAL